MNKLDLLDWKRHPVTQIVLNQINQRILDIQEILSEQAGFNPIKDREYVGAIKAFRDMLNIEIDEVEETQDD